MDCQPFNAPVWCFPPPPLFTTNTSLATHPTQSTSDFETRFQHFMQSRRQTAPTQQRPPLISHAKTTLTHVHDLIQSVQQQSLLLQEHMSTMSDTDYAMASSNVEAQQQIISDLLDSVAKPNQLALVVRAINKRRMKRNRVRSTRRKRLIPSKPSPCSQTPSIPITTTQTPSVSKLLPQSINAYNIDKRALSTPESNRAAAFLSLFEQLKELHRIRSQQSGKVSRTPPMLEHLQSLWTDAVARYNREERTPDTNTDESPSTEQMWQRVLFGHIKRDTRRLEAEPDLQQLISVRKCWDAFLVDQHNPFGSSIPLGVVFPSGEASRWYENPPAFDQNEAVDVDQDM